MKNKWPIVFAVLILVASSLACQALNRELSLSNLRMAFDQEGENVTTTFSPTDVFFAVADLYNAPQGTQLEARWTAVNVADLEPNTEFQTQTVDITDESYSGTVYFQLSSAEAWPVGQYKVDVYLNGTLVQTVEFSVQ
jgi:serine protease inhibitor